MDELLNQIITTSVGLSLLAGGYLIWLLTGVSNWAFNDKKWSWKRMFEDIAKATLWGIAIIAWVALCYGLEWFAGKCGCDIKALMDGASTAGVIGGIIGGTIFYAVKAYKNIINFVNASHVEAVVNNPNYSEIAEKVYELIETTKDAVEATKHFEEEKKAEGDALDGGRGVYYSVPHDTYDHFRAEVLGKGYDLDGAYGPQCLTAGHLVSMADGTYKPVEELEVGEIVFGGNRVVSNEEHEASLYKVETSLGNLIVSAGHRFMLEDGSECAVEEVYDKYIAVDDHEPDEIYHFTDDELRFLGFYLGDGTKKYRHAGTTKPEILVTVGTETKKTYLKNLNVTLNEGKHSNGRASVFRLVNRDHEKLCDFIHQMCGKELPRSFTKEQYALIIEGYMNADGTCKGNSTVITSVNKLLLASIQFGCILNGWRAKLSDPSAREATNYCDHPKDIYRLTINKNRAPRAHVYAVRRTDDDSVFVLNLDGDHTYFADNLRQHNCWDGACLLWQQLGRWLSTGGTGAARGCWTVSKNENAGNDFDLITNKKDVQRGDVVVFGFGEFGHIGYADEDYNGGTYIRLLGQNQTADMKFSVVNVSMAQFLGAFRYKAWRRVEPQPQPTPKPDKKGEVSYKYKAGDTFGQVICNLGLKTGHGLWGPDGDVAYYTKQLNEQGIYGNIPIGKTIKLTPRS